MTLNSSDHNSSTATSPVVEAAAALTKLKGSLGAALETTACEFERTFGLRQIVEFTNKSLHRDSYVKDYQAIIRDHLTEWPYRDDWVASYSGFMSRYDRSARDYLRNAGSLYMGLIGANPTEPFVLFEIAVLSEASRGREGKRSAIGLDRLQEETIPQLEELLKPVWRTELGSLDDAINQFMQRLPAGYSSASEQEELFQKYITEFNQILTLENVEAADSETEGLVSLILRGYSAYSLPRFNATLLKLRQSANTYTLRRDQAHESYEAFTKRATMIAGLLNNDASTQFSTLVHNIAVLNFLNDYLDVKYSFKSFAGLVHLHAFDLAFDGADPKSSLRELGEHLARKSNN